MFVSLRNDNWAMPPDSPPRPGGAGRGGWRVEIREAQESASAPSIFDSDERPEGVRSGSGREDAETLHNPLVEANASDLGFMLFSTDLAHIRSALVAVVGWFS